MCKDDQIEQLKERIVELENTLHYLRIWVNAYPLRIFPEPDLKLAAKTLGDAGITLDAVSASAMRHVLTQVAEMIDEAQPAPRADTGADKGE
jgi:hypothetical protein